MKNDLLSDRVTAAGDVAETEAPAPESVPGGEVDVDDDAVKQFKALLAGHRRTLAEQERDLQQLTLAQIAEQDRQRAATLFDGTLERKLQALVVAAIPDAAKVFAERPAPAAVREQIRKPAPEPTTPIGCTPEEHRRHWDELVDLATVHIERRHWNTSLRARALSRMTVLVMRPRLGRSPRRRLTLRRSPARSPGRPERPRPRRTGAPA
jgi:hypothetical protein